MFRVKGSVFRVSRGSIPTLWPFRQFFMAKVTVTVMK